MAKTPREIYENSSDLKFKKFANNVLSSSELSYAIFEASYKCFGDIQKLDSIDNLAGNFLLNIMRAVGANKRTDLVQVARLKELLQGTLNGETEIQKCAEYLLSQMIVKPKGKAAEYLTLTVMMDFLKTHSDFDGREDDRIKTGVYCHQVRKESGGFTDSWHPGPDLLICSTSSIAEDIQKHDISKLRDLPLLTDGLFVSGIVEVKAYRGTTRKKLDAQLRRHFQRITGGIIVSDLFSQEGREYSPEDTWLYVSYKGLPQLVCAADINNGCREDIYCNFQTLTVGPRQTRTHRSNSVFDLEMRFTEDDLEDVGLDIAYYTIGAMADQPDIDLCGQEWSDNIRKVFSSTESGLTPRQYRRQAKLLGQFYE